MLAGRGLGDLQLAGDQYSADSVFDQVAIALGREVFGRAFEPFQDLQALVIGQSAEEVGGTHIVN